MDANTTSAAYNPQIIEARKASLAEKLRRAIGLRRGVEESVPQEQKVLSAKLRLRELAEYKPSEEALRLRDATLAYNKFIGDKEDWQAASNSEKGLKLRGAHAVANNAMQQKGIQSQWHLPFGIGKKAKAWRQYNQDMDWVNSHLSAKLRLRELARQTAYDPYAVQAQPAEPGQAGRDFRNAAIGIGALGAGGGVAYAGFRGAQAAKSAQTLTDDALKTSGEARKAARSARVAAARVNRAGKVIKTQLTTFPTFKKVASKIFEEDLQGLKELAAKSDDWRNAGYIGYATGGIPNAMQGMQIQQYYANKGVEYRKRDALKHALPGFLAGSAALPIAIKLAKSINNKPTIRGNLVRKLVVGAVPATAVLGINAMVGGKNQAVPDREKRIKAKEFSDREYDQLAQQKRAENLRKSNYIGSNIASYHASALGGAAMGLATGGLLLGSRGVTKKAALIGAAGLVGARAAMQPKINKWEDRALKSNLADAIANDSGLVAARNVPFLAATAGTAAILMNRGKILKATEKIAKKFRTSRVVRPGKWEVIPAPKGDLPMPSRIQLPNS